MGRYSVMRYKTKRRTRDLDLIFKDLSTPESIELLKHQPLDETKPGLGQYYCIHCAKYCETRAALASHLKTKVHKRRVRELKVKPYTQEESDAASGVGLQKFQQDVEKYKQINERRLVLEKELLGDKQLEELKLKDELNELRLNAEPESGEVEMQV